MARYSMIRVFKMRRTIWTAPEPANPVLYFVLFASTDGIDRQVDHASTRYRTISALVQHLLVIGFYNYGCIPSSYHSS